MHIHKHLTNTLFVAPRSVFSTVSPHKGPSHSALCTIPLCTLSCATQCPSRPGHTAVPQPGPPHSSPHLTCICTSCAPQCQLVQHSLNSVSTALPAPGCALLKCPTCHQTSLHQQQRTTGAAGGQQYRLDAEVGKKQRKGERGRRKKIRAGRGPCGCSQMLI